MLNLVCQLCGQHVQEMVACEGCHALCYCSDKHRKLHAKMAHAEECARMKLQLQRAQVRCEVQLARPAET